MYRRLMVRRMEQDVPLLIVMLVSAISIMDWIKKGKHRVMLSPKMIVSGPMRIYTHIGYLMQDDHNLVSVSMYSIFWIVFLLTLVYLSINLH